jgi:hypothetical protein
MYIWKSQANSKWSAERVLNVEVQRIKKSPLLFDVIMGESNRLLKNVHLRRSPRPSSLRRTSKYASLLRISGALHLSIFDQPYKSGLFSTLLTHPCRAFLTSKSLSNIKPFHKANACSQ